jgi:hypothetical protein
LSCPGRFDTVISAEEANAITLELVGDEPSGGAFALAVEFARAHLHLRRIRSTRADLIAKIDFNQVNIHQLQRLAALDRYERYAYTKRRRASVKL